MLEDNLGGPSQEMEFEPPTELDFGLMTSIAFGALQAQTLGAAVRLGVIEAISESGSVAAEVAQQCGAGEREIARLLQTLATMGLLRAQDGRYWATAAGRLVDGRARMSMKPMVELFTDTLTVRAWERLDESIRTGEASFPGLFGKPFFDYLGDDDEAAQRFDGAMTQLGSFLPLEQMFEFSSYRTIVDVGGGEGTFLTRILHAHPGVHGTLLDREAAITRAQAKIRDAGLDERFTGEVGDFFEQVPAGADLYVLKGIMHDWNDEKAVQILQTVRKAMRPDSRLLLIDAILQEGGGPEARDSYLMDLNLLVNFGGGERTAAQQYQLLEAAGFEPPEIRPLPPPAGIAFIVSTAKAG